MRTTPLLLPLLLFSSAAPAVAIDAPSSIPMEPDHCIAITWERWKEIDFTAFMDPSCTPFLTKLYVTANGSRCEENKLMLSYWCPGSLNPDIYYVALWHEDIPRPLDVFWLVVNSPRTQQRFDAWVGANTNTSWTASLPRPYAAIAVTNGVATDPEPPGPDGRPGLWDAPHRIDPKSYLHHNAVWEMRTTVAGDHGNQATFDGNGILIRSTIAAGTADHCGPYDETGSLKTNFRHRNEDVWPYIFALQLDGNPVHISGLADIPRALTRPCIVQGPHTETYLRLRPTILP